MIFKKKFFKGQYFVNTVQRGRKLGVAILFKAHLDISIIKLVKDDEGRTLSLLCQFNEKYLFNIVCLYAPNNPSNPCNQYFVTNHDNRTVTDRIVQFFI